MSENKRFELAYEKDDWWAVRDGEITLWKEEVIYLLNELYEENVKLKQEIQGLKDDRLRFEEEARIDAIDKVLDEENERLKQENHDIKYKIEELYYTYIYEPSQSYDEDSCDKIIRGIINGVEKDD